MPARMKAYALNTNLVVALVVRIPHDGLKESAVDSDGTTKAYLAWGVSGDHHPIRNRRSCAYAGATARADGQVGNAGSAMAWEKCTLRSPRTLCSAPGSATTVK